MSKPTLLKHIASLVVAQKTVVHLDIHKHFFSDQGGLVFSLEDPVPSWLSIDSLTGVVFGEAPAVLHSTQYLITVKVSNSAGSVLEYFLIKVTDEKFISSMTSAALHLKRNKTLSESSDHHLRTHEILAYIFEYYRASKYWDEFRGLIQASLSKMNVNVSNPIEYKNFREAILAENPEVEEQLRAELGDEHLLLDVELTNETFHNLYRQGSQPQGVHPIMVWNCLGAPSLHNWTHVKTVLHESVEAVIATVTEAQKKVLQQSRTPRPLIEIPKK
jgi:hypothetical protein